MRRTSPGRPPRPRGGAGSAARFNPVSGVRSGKRDVRVEIIETSSLGDRSYVVSDGETASSSTHNETSTG